MRHMEREEPQGEETGDPIASLAHLNRAMNAGLLGQQMQQMDLNALDQQQLNNALHRQHMALLSGGPRMTPSSSAVDTPIYSNTRPIVDSPSGFPPR